MVNDPVLFLQADFYLDSDLLNRLHYVHPDEKVKLTYKYQGRHFRLTDVRGEVVKDLLAWLVYLPSHAS